MAQTLAEQVQQAAKAVGCSVATLIQQAYIWMYGKVQGIKNEARLACERCLKLGTFCERALAAIRGYLSYVLELDPAPA